MLSLHVLGNKVEGTPGFVSHYRLQQLDIGDCVEKVEQFDRIPHLRLVKQDDESPTGLQTLQSENKLTTCQPRGLFSSRYFATCGICARNT